MIPILLDRGLAPMRAATAMSLLSLGAVAGRLGTGFLLDRVPAPIIGAGIFALPIVACIILLTMPATLPVAFLSAACFGFAVGAELDLTAYITARYFGIGSYGTIYGLMGAIYAGGGASLPPIMGQIYDRQGSYTGAIVLLGCLFFSSAAVLQFLRVPDQGEASAATKAVHG
jgi:MFS family permease